jgi:hypothetical protein
VAKKRNPKSTYNKKRPTVSRHVFSSYSTSLREYPHAHDITFIVVTNYAPKSTYSPMMDNSILEWSDRTLRDAIDEIMEGMQ